MYQAPCPALPPSSPHGTFLSQLIQRKGQDIDRLKTCPRWQSWGGAGLDDEFHSAGLQGLSQNRAPRLPSPRGRLLLRGALVDSALGSRQCFTRRCTDSRILPLIWLTGAATALGLHPSACIFPSGQCCENLLYKPNGVMLRAQAPEDEVIPDQSILLPFLRDPRQRQTLRMLLRGLVWTFPLPILTLEIQRIISWSVGKFPSWTVQRKETIGLHLTKTVTRSNTFWAVLAESRQTFICLLTLKKSKHLLSFVAILIYI